MKQITFLFAVCLATGTTTIAQNVGINTNSPVQKLDVNGKIKIGNDATPATAGTIRFNEALQDFEGFNGIEWKSLTASYSSAPSTNNAGVMESLGSAVAIYGNYAVVGAPKNNWICGGGTQSGKAYIFRKTGNSWAYVQDITPTASNLGVGCYQQYGKAVAMYDNYLVVGAPDADVSGFAKAGAVFVYKLSGTTWTYLQKIVASNAADQEHFGSSLSLYGNYLAVGAQGSQYISYPSAIGRTYVFTKSSGSFSQVQVINNPTNNYDDQFGVSVSIDSTSLAVGSAACTVGANAGQGKVYMYKNTGSTYTFTNEIINSAGNSSDNFGYCVSINGNDLAIGCPNYDNGGLNNSGAVYTTVKDGSGNFTNAALSIIISSEEASERYFGYSVSVYQKKLLIGAPGGVNNSANGYFGASHLYTKPSGSWEFSRVLSRGNPSTDFANGYALSIQGLYYILGDPNALINGRNIIGDIRY